jgi:hypothetical protein
MRLTKTKGSFDVLLPDMSTNFDKICMDRIRNMTELSEILNDLSLDANDLPTALTNDDFALFSYLSQLAILRVLPYNAQTYLHTFPHVSDNGTNLCFQQGDIVQVPNTFIDFINTSFLGNRYNGYQYLAGDYPFCKDDIDECQERMAVDICTNLTEQFTVFDDPNKFLTAVSCGKPVKVSDNNHIDFCFSDFLERGKHYCSLEDPTITLPNDYKTHQQWYIETWANPVVKRIYMIEVLRRVAVTNSI